MTTINFYVDGNGGIHCFKKRIKAVHTGGMLSITPAGPNNPANVSFWYRPLPGPVYFGLIQPGNTNIVPLPPLAGVAVNNTGANPYQIPGGYLPAAGNYVLIMCDDASLSNTIASLPFTV
jgi:hypothetical protein